MPVNIGEVVWKNTIGNNKKTIAAQQKKVIDRPVDFMGVGE